MTKPTAQSGFTSVSNRIAYGLGDTGFLLVWQASALFLLYFYTDVLGIPAALAGAIFLVAMIWDAVSDPLVAAWAERRAARTGRYAPIMAGAALPVGLSFVAMFAVPASGPVLTAILALLAHLAFRTAFTFASMPYNTLPLRLSADSDERSTLSGFRVAGAAIGGLAAAICVPVIVLASGSEGVGYRVAAIVVGAVAALCLYLSARGCGERVAVRESSRARSLRGDLAGLWQGLRGNGPLQRLAGVMALGTIGYAFFTSSALYFVNHVVGEPGLAAAFLAIPAFMTLLAAPLWVLVARRSSKRVALMSGLAVAVTGYLALFAAPSAPVVVLLSAVAIAGLGGTAIPVMMWSMVPDALDYGSHHTGERIEARAFGLLTFIQKCATGLTLLAAGGLLAIAGYDADAGELTASSRLAILAMTAGLPALFMAGIVLVVRRYPVSRETHRALTAAPHPPGGAL
ncbi:glycoside-pentoside-hexuronide (GPH):cation symporter [Hyphobacterium sp. Y6023]|uniref:Glycoside-pentoside-hexuronide (GPH):cation symporter n=2 Tax=Hyphobacterium marinum TaxID=3116574 RepID=A0ABU7LU85_9PROT|nr:glycoside-pentoside-hexuronide (GPH):cation symporter [Hyphobacterium sp. Y6023]